MQGEHELFASDPLTRAIYTNEGGPIGAGGILCNANLGGTLRRIAQDGRKNFYEGEIAKEIAAFSQARGGLLTEEDLGNYHAHWAEPIHVNYRGYEVYEMPPNSSGHILLQELNIVELFELQSMGCNTAETIHLMVEAKKLAFADREKYMADPEWVDIPLAGMLSKAYAAEQAERIDKGRAAYDVPAGGPEAHEDTTCFCTADRAGNLVCILQSIQSGFGSSLIAGRDGYIAKQPDDILAPGGGPSELPDAGQAGAAYDEPGDCYEGWKAGLDVWDAGRGYPGADESATGNAYA